MDLKRELAERAAELGFARFGVAEAVRLEQDGARLAEWIDAGFHGEMGYMAETAEVRADPRHPRMLAGARSVIVLATPYGQPDSGSVGPRPGRVARYARGRDYHNVLHKRLRKLTARLREAGHEAHAE